MFAEKGLQGGAVLFAPPRKSYRFFSPPSPRRKSMRRGVSPLRRRQGTLPLDPTSIFEKLLDQKTSLPPAAIVFYRLLSNLSLKAIPPFLIPNSEFLISFIASAGWASTGK
ncbi:hypothetical protein [Ruminococcus sp.]|uniref:hypothetical protein n=1 Tax=Ruminococcus sp. TaxID=41978 RepID=UPI0025CE0563|nr:hypothetical protein [Ruminococcus sp.]